MRRVARIAERVHRGRILWDAMKLSRLGKLGLNSPTRAFVQPASPLLRWRCGSPSRAGPLCVATALSAGLVGDLVGVAERRAASG
jgi:hypothetical protein